jgi:hypothetical protein
MRTTLQVTGNDRRFWEACPQAATELKGAFEAEGTLRLWRSRDRESRELLRLHESGTYRLSAQCRVVVEERRWYSRWNNECFQTFRLLDRIDCASCPRLYCAFMESKGDHVQPNSLEWALAHLLNFGDTDLLPVPFEYEAIKADWQTIKQELLKRDLSELSPGAAVHFLVPKPEGTFRVVTRMDPLDAVLYTAVAEYASTVEASRPLPATACSYRINLSSEGQFFSSEHAWDAWPRRSLELMGESGVKYVVTADIEIDAATAYSADRSMPYHPIAQ